MGVVLSVDDNASVKLSEEMIVENTDGNSLLFFEELSVQTGDIIHLTLDKEGYEKLVFEVTVEY